VLLEAQPTKEFVTSEQVAALALRHAPGPFDLGDRIAQTGSNIRSIEETSSTARSLVSIYVGRRRLRSEARPPIAPP